MYKLFKIIISLLLIIIVLWGFSDSYSSHNIDNIVNVVAIGIDEIDDYSNDLKVSFQFINVESQSESSSSSENSSVVTSIKSNSLNKAIHLMNSYIGKELNFSHCKVIVFSEAFAQKGISTEIYTLVNNEEFRPSTNIIISTSDANSYLKNSNPNIEKLVTNYYDTLELTSNFTGYSDNMNLGKFFNNLFTSSKANTAILGRTFKKTSSDTEGSNNSSETTQSITGERNKSDSNTDSKSTNGKETGQNSGGNSSQNDSGGAYLEISGQRGTQNVGIAVFKEDKYVGQLSELETICHLLVTNNVDSFVLSINKEDYPDKLLDLNVSPIRKSSVKVSTNGEHPCISVSVYCEAKILTVGNNYDYLNNETLENLSSYAQKYLKDNIENYLYKTSKELDCDIADFSQQALSNFLTISDWDNYNWPSTYSNVNFDVKVSLDIVSSLLFSGDQ